MVAIRIVRDSGYSDRLRACRVLVDGLKIGTINDGETREFLIPAGQHRVSLKIDWCGSNVVDFVAIEGAPVTFHAKSNLRGFRIFLGMWYVLFQRNSYLVLERNLI